MTYSLASHIMITETEHGMVLLDENNGRYWQMNGTGATVLRRILEEGNAESVITDLRERHPAAAERIEADVTALVTALLNARVLSS
ncbi:Coenzyme PQQ synthesis protein D (PqqD) [Thermomonospora echinospora]|uniref:Coenzyme PQQ synthesis protein D (PqqD) n=1 Tax=Thermomonospora echinospora TaxID=1992 RepID=A0A1H6D1C6_9ACTN|nr:lasso peptide biosynthesis PqqD family chaperone [Thermomonospora echinospora]SEG78818.1 Coenzyme PQQ synthesis protein D (PqqD) [Thermomonospora echinospora]